MIPKEKFVQFNEIAPLQTTAVLNHPFSYR